MQRCLKHISAIGLPQVDMTNVEATMHRIKRTFGFCTQFKLEKSRCNEITIKMNVLNRMLLLGKAEYHEGVFQKGDKLPKKTSETSKKLDQNALKFSHLSH